MKTQNKLFLAVFMVAFLLPLLTVPAVVNSPREVVSDLGMREDPVEIVKDDGPVPESRMAPAVVQEWLDGWSFRQSHTISGSTGAGTDYPVLIRVIRDSGSSIQGTIFVDSNCQADYGDIRFTDDDGETVLDCWLQEYDSYDATFWVEVADDLGSDQDIFVYYGTSGTSTTTSDADDVFLFYDDFEYTDALTNHGWTAAGSYIDTTPNKKVYGSYGMFGNAGPNPFSNRFMYWGPGTDIDYDVMVHSWVRVEESTDSAEYVLFGEEADGTDVYIATVLQADLGSYQSGWEYYTSGDDVSDDTWYELEVGLDFTNSEFVLFLDGDRQTDLALENDAGATVTEFDKIGSVTSHKSSPAQDHYMDDFYIRKWIESEPQHDGWGDEESRPVAHNLPYVTNYDDGGLFARHRVYLVDIDFSHSGGYSMFDHVELEGEWSSGSWKMRFDEGTNVFSEQTGTSYIELVGANCSYTKSGDFLNLTFGFMIEWAHPDDVDVYMNATAVDSTGLWGDPVETSDYDVASKVDVTNLVLNDGSGLADDGDTDGTVVANMTVVYHMSELEPDESVVDVYVYQNDVGSSPWQMSRSGDFYIGNVVADDVVGLDTYSTKVVVNGTGFGGTDVTNTGDTDMYIADKVKVIYIAASNDFPDSGSDVVITVGLTQDYDEDEITTGSFSLSYGSTYLSLSHDVGVNWTVTDNHQAGRYVYDLVNGSDTYYGLTFVNMNGESLTVDWGNLSVHQTGFQYGDYGVLIDSENMTGASNFAIFNATYHSVDSTWRMSLWFDFNMSDCDLDQDWRLEIKFRLENIVRTGSDWVDLGYNESHVGHFNIMSWEGDEDVHTESEYVAQYCDIRDHMNGDFLAFDFTEVRSSHFYIEVYYARLYVAA
ncbi:MAG: DUF2341 domain-containing protein [Candidatus Thorarchaeota archaeon]